MYTLTFKKNGGSGDVPEPTKYDEGETVDVNITLTRATWSLYGFGTLNERGGITIFKYTSGGHFSFTMPGEDLTLYAY